MPEGVTLIMFLVGPTIGAAYLLSSLGRRWAIANGDRPSPSAGIEVASALLAAGLAWLLIRYAAPGRTTFRNASAIGFLSSQVLTAWSSVALWAGLAAVLGHVAPLTSRLRSGTAGVAGAFALLVTFLPITALAAIGAWIGTLAVSREVRPAMAMTYGSVVVAEWLLGVINPPVPYGLVHGPETTLFVAGLAGVLAVRWSVGDVGRPPGEAVDQ